MTLTAVGCELFSRSRASTIVITLVFSLPLPLLVSSRRRRRAVAVRECARRESADHAAPCAAGRALRALPHAVRLAHGGCASECATPTGSLCWCCVCYCVYKHAVNVCRFFPAVAASDLRLRSEYPLVSLCLLLRCCVCSMLFVCLDVLQDIRLEVFRFMLSFLYSADIDAAVHLLCASVLVSVSCYYSHFNPDVVQVRVWRVAGLALGCGGCGGSWTTAATETPTKAATTIGSHLCCRLVGSGGG